MSRDELYIQKILEVAIEGKKSISTLLPALKAIIALCKEYKDYKNG